MKLLRFLLTVSILAVAAPTAFAGETADTDGKKQIYIINGKRAEPFDPSVADMWLFNVIDGDAAEVAKLATEAGISEQELSECDVVMLESKIPITLAEAGRSVAYSGTATCEENKVQGIHILTPAGETDAEGKFTLRAKHDSSVYVEAEGFGGRLVRLSTDLRRKITLSDTVTDKEENHAEEKKPRYHIVNGKYVRPFNIKNYGEDDIISVKQIWESTAEVREALTNANIAPDLVKEHGAEVVILREGVHLAKQNSVNEYTLEISDKYGNPISGATVFEGMAQTNFSGRFKLTADCGTPAIAVYERDNRLKVKRFEFGAVSAMNLQMERILRNDETDSMPFNEVYAMAQFRGGDITSFRNWIRNNVYYPQKMQAHGIEGRVLASFVVGEDGSVDDIEVIESPHKDLSKVVVNALKRSPKWSPALDGGKPVRMKFTIPADFRKN